jgi:hypothetical protein
MAESTTWLYRTRQGIFLAPKRSPHATHEVRVDEEFVLRHLSAIPTRAHRFTKNDASFVELVNKLIDS